MKFYDHAATVVGITKAVAAAIATVQVANDTVAWWCGMAIAALFAVQGYLTNHTDES